MAVITTDIKQVKSVEEFIQELRDNAPRITDMYVICKDGREVSSVRLKKILDDYFLAISKENDDPISVMYDNIDSYQLVMAQ